VAVMAFVGVVAKRSC